MPDTGPTPNGAYNAATLFWRHEQLHRATLRDYAIRITQYQSERDALEQRLIAGALTCDVAQRAAFSARCFAEADKAEARWLERIGSGGVYPGLLYASAWRGFDRKAALSVQFRE